VDVEYERGRVCAINLAMSVGRRAVAARRSKGEGLHATTTTTAGRLRASRRSSARARVGARSRGRFRVFALVVVVVDSDAALRELAPGARDVSRERLGFGFARGEPNHASRDDDDGVQRERNDGVDRGLWIWIRSRARGVSVFVSRSRSRSRSRARASSVVPRPPALARSA